MSRTRALLAMVPIFGATMLGLAPSASADRSAEISGTEFGDEPIGVDCGTFEVWDDFELNWRGQEFYDDDGNVVRVVEHIWGVDRLYNPESGASVSGTFSNSETVDLVNGQITENGSIFRIVLPGAGAVFLDVGKFVLRFGEGVVFLAGRHDFFEGDTEALCAALS
jgi:hypothetical protein